MTRGHHGIMRGLWIAFAAVGTVLIAWLIMRPSVAEPRRPPSAPVTRPTPVPTLTVESQPTVAPVSGATPSPTAAPAVPGSIGGVVVTTNDKPVAGADVSALIEGEVCAMARCNEAGAFKIDRLPVGESIEIKATAAWHALDRARTYELSAKKPHLSILVRMVEAGSVSGTVRDTAGRPIAGVEVKFAGTTTKTGAAGEYVLNDLAADEYSATANAPGYCGERRDKIAVRPGKLTDGIDFRLTPGIRVMGRVVSKAGKEEHPESAVLVVADRIGLVEDPHNEKYKPGQYSEPVDCLTSTSLDGSFVFEHLAPGNYFFEARKRELFAVAEDVDVTTTMRPIIIVLPPEGTLRGVVLGRGGVFVSGAAVKLSMAPMILAEDALHSELQSAVEARVRANNSDFSATSDFEGKFQFSGLKSGEEYGVTVAADGYATTNTALRADSSIEHRIQLTAGCVLTGRVVTSNTNAPAAGASLRLVGSGFSDGFDARATANFAGEFRFERVPPGHYVIGGRRISPGLPPLFVRTMEGIRLAEGESKSIELSADAPAAVSGSVLDQDKQPLSGVEVSLELADNAIPYSVADEFGATASAKTDDDGNYAIAMIAPGDLTGKAYKDGYEDKEEGSRTTSAKPGQKVEHFDFTLIDEDKNPLKQDVSIKGRVIGPDRRPIGGITVWLYHEEGEDDEKRFEKGKSTTTDAQGRFAFTQKRGLVSGVVVLPTRALPCFGLAPVSADITLRVQRCARASGLVTDTYAHRIEAATVRFEVTGSPAIDSLFSTEEYDVETDANGAFAIDLLPPLECRIFAYKDGYESHEEGEATVTLAPGEEKTDLLLLLDPEGTFKGRLLDAQGRPLADWSVDGNSERDADGFFKYSLSEIRTLVDFDHEDKFESGLTRDVGYVTGSIDYPRRKPAEVTQWTIPATGSVSGRIVYADGTPAAHLHGALALSDEQTASAFDQCVLQSCTVDHTDLTGADGRFRLDAVPPGTFGLSFDGKAVASTKIENVVVRSGQNTDVGTITVARGATARGRLIDAATRQPITSAKYRLEPQGVESDGSDADVKLSDFDGDGWFTIDSISPTLGRVQLNVMKKNVYSGAWDYTGSVALPAHKAGEVMNLGDVALPAQKK